MTKDYRKEIEEANAKLDKENKDFPYQEEEPFILINDSVVFYHPIELRTFAHGFWEIVIKKGQHTLMSISQKNIESVLYVCGHGV